MKLLLKTALLAGALTLSSGPALAADLIPYPDSGSYNTTTYTFTAASSGDIIAYIVGGFSAGYANEVGLLVNGVQTGAGFGLNNHTSASGDSFNLGFANIGDTLTFILHNLDLGQDAYSDASLNAAYDLLGDTSGHNHVYSTNYTGTSPLFAGVPVGTYVAFEDLQFPGADFNYDDESFVFSNVSSVVSGAVPEPATWALMIAGFGLIGGAMRRANGQRRTKVRVTYA